MSAAAIDLDTVAARLADRAPGRAEATVQSDVRLFLLAARLNLVDGEILDVVLEAPAGKLRRVDVEVGARRSSRSRRISERATMMRWWR